ncbi:TauD/TfdA family dioxygenase [Bradyrhizobium sp. Leo121]|uniref:TauD/TfdA dioxygenase family protein n=1 Tax=Bradyrhizobium sp. Leo121 TaxID=1571195 RepID=UPI001028DF0D|nr:TauD/TfdA family dioxygenase [Bradyrhizobium sp. Leo121]RZN30179.1 2,4-dichlorophenoxyacetate dioxygenase [Bradyrhizobium sp. Leo121]
MTIIVRPLHPIFVAEVSGVDLRCPVDREIFREIEAALDRYAVLIFRAQPLADEQQIAFSQLFGRLETSIGTIRKDRKHRLGRQEIADVSNLDEDNNVRLLADRWCMMILANQLWHTDSSFKRVPGKVSLLSAHEVPPNGGETEFADLRAAYDSLDEATKARIDNLVAEHSIFHSRSLIGYTDFSDQERATLPAVPQTLVRVHPGSGRKTLYLASHASHIVGWPVDQGRALLDELMSFATQPCFVYQHRWRVGDLVVWDNRCTLHRGRPFNNTEDRRDMRRTTVEDLASTLEQSHLAEKS